jgi:hypothetical protein
VGVEPGLAFARRGIGEKRDELDLLADLYPRVVLLLQVIDERP